MQCRRGLGRRRLGLAGARVYRGWSLRGHAQRPIPIDRARLRDVQLDVWLTAAAFALVICVAHGQVRMGSCSVGWGKWTCAHCAPLLLTDRRVSRGACGFEPDQHALREPARGAGADPRGRACLFRAWLPQLQLHSSCCRATEAPKSGNLRAANMPCGLPTAVGAPRDVSGNGSCFGLC